MNKWQARFSQFFILVVFLLTLNGCIPRPSQNISRETSFNKDEGILITKIRSNINHGKVLIHGKGEKWPRINFSAIDTPEDLRVIKIKSGEAYFSKIFIGELFLNLPVMYFTIQPETITYVGDLVAEVGTGEDGLMRLYSGFIDGEEPTIKEAKDRFPWIFEKYPYRTNMPERSK